MLSKKMQEALNSQINAEYYSAYLYLSMAAYCDRINLKGFGHWFRIQVQEETVHVMKFFDYVLDRGGEVALAPVEGPTVKWDSPLAAFEAALKHEQYITQRIGKLVDLAISESDHLTNALLQWFLNEQVEEEATADQIVHELKLAGDAPAALFMIDRELGARVFNAVGNGGGA
jgi:ferritin